VFGFSLLWAILLGTVCVIFLVEMAGRLTAVSKHTLISAIRERFGWKMYCVLYCANVFVDYLVLASEIGGVSFALQLATGIAFRWWALPVTLVAWFLLWKGNFGIIEKGVALLGLVTLCFVVAACKLHPPVSDLFHGALPSLPTHNAANYWFIAVSILGALISPYLFYFYSSGAVEDKWDEKDLGINRAVAALGMGFGSIVSIGVLIAAAMIFLPRGIKGDSYDQIALLLTPVLGHWGFWLVVASVGIACFGAACEVGLDFAYATAQTFGWQWGENLKPVQASRFSLCYTVFLFLAALPITFGLDPLQLTLFSMAITAVILPLVILPFLLLMNDEAYVGEHRNGPIGNTVVVFTIALAFMLAVVAIPLEIIGG
jgi:Mn2+/Fe2+ NRAMP family transporter